MKLVVFLFVYFFALEQGGVNGKYIGRNVKHVLKRKDTNLKANSERGNIDHSKNPKTQVSINRLVTDMKSGLEADQNVQKFYNKYNENPRILAGKGTQSQLSDSNGAVKRNSLADSHGKLDKLLNMMSGNWDMFKWENSMLTEIAQTLSYLLTELRGQEKRIKRLNRNVKTSLRILLDGKDISKVLRSKH